MLFAQVRTEEEKRKGKQGTKARDATGRIAFFVRPVKERRGGKGGACAASN